MTRQDSMTCASDLRSGMSDEQLVLLHRQISRDPHRTYIAVETRLKGLGGALGPMVSPRRFGKSPF